MKTFLLVRALLIFGSITIGSGILRLEIVASGLGAAGLPETEFDRRYVEHPWLSYLHIVPGIVFFLLAPFQFVPSIRSRMPVLHRWAGRVALTCGLFAGATAIVVAAIFPAYGGWLTAVSTYLFGVYMIVALVLAYRAIRRRKVAAHRRWMVRAVSVGLGVTTIRLFLGIFGGVFGVESEQSFGPSFAFGFLVNAIIAELIIARPLAKYRARTAAT